MTLDERVNAHQDLVLAIVNARFSHMRHMRDDLVAAGNIGLMRAHKTYDPAKASFGTYARTQIWRSIMDAVRTEVSQTRFTHTAARELPTGIECHRQPLGNPNLANLRTLLRDLLTPVEHTAIYLCFFQHKTMLEAAEIMGVSRGTMHNLRVNAYRKLRKNNTIGQLFLDMTEAN